MAVPLERVDIEERAFEEAEELAQKRFGLSFDSLTQHQQMSLWLEAEQDIRERLNEQAELDWEEKKLRESMRD